MTHPTPIFFYRRPRRFGKSLTISTLESLLRGEKELFQGLSIYTKWNWTVYSVIRLNFSQVVKFNSEKELADMLNDTILSNAKKYEIHLTEKHWYKNLTNLISQLKKNGLVAILIDEYDAPFHYILNKTAQLQESTKEVFAKFYSLLKANELAIDFLFITGITKIAKASLFSGMNQLEDISNDAEYAALCGITQTELESYFKDYIERLAQIHSMTPDMMKNTLQQMYNGYRFSPDSMLRVYNPFSLIKAFSSGRLMNHWFSTATPTLLLRLIENENYDLSFLQNPTLSLSEVMDSFDFISLPLKNLLFQTGYLTIQNVLPYDNSLSLLKKYDTRFTLDFPNEEVKHSFYDALLNFLTKEKLNNYDLSNGKKLIQMIQENKWDEFAHTWNQLLARIPNSLHIDQERYYHSLILLFALIFGMKVQPENSISTGRIDLSVEVTDKIYIIEFKLGHSAQKALEQIHTQRYFEAYSNSPKKIFLVGINFDFTIKGIKEILVEEFKKNVIKSVYNHGIK